jgi:pimeloyl-ACP methyl ester carboxylesterase
MASGSNRAHEKHELYFTGYDEIQLVADAIGNPENTHVLFAHGGGQTRYAWGGTAKALADRGFYAISLDMRGHGDSSWCPDKNYDLEHYSRDLVEVAKALAQKTHVVGASLGGLSAMLVEGRIAPGTFQSLTMVDITPRMEDEGVKQTLGFMVAHSKEGFASLEEAADIISDYLPHRTRPKSTKGLSKNLRLGEDNRYRWHWDPAFVTRSNMARQERKDVPVGPNLEDAAADIKIPTHLIRGQLSQMVSKEAAQHFLESVPQAHYTDISDAGHMIAGDRNDVFTEAVVSFLFRLQKNT